MKWYFKALRQYADFGGRARRKEFWMFVLFYLIFFILFAVIDIAANLVPENMLQAGIPYGVFTTTYLWAMLIPYWAVTVRRLHDTGHSGWFMLVALIPLIGSIWLLVLLIQDGKREENCYGADPKTSANKWDVNKNNSNIFIFAAVAMLITHVSNFLGILQHHGSSTFEPEQYLIMLFPSYGIFEYKDFIRFLLPVGLLMIGIFLRRDEKEKVGAGWCIIIYAVFCLSHMLMFLAINGETWNWGINSIFTLLDISLSFVLLFVGIQLIQKKNPAISAVLLIIIASLIIILSLWARILYFQPEVSASILFLLEKISIIISIAYIVFGCSLLRKSDFVEEQSAQQYTTQANFPKPKSVAVQQPQNVVYAPSTSVTTYQLFTGSGVCDVCNCQLGSIKAYIVPNSVFYNSRAYRTHLKQLLPWTTDADIDRMKQQDRSVGSAVCENCIHMF